MGQMEQLCRLIESSHAQIVLLSSSTPSVSSADHVEAALTKWGLEPPIGVTPETTWTGGGRAAEIGTWLHSNFDLVDQGRWTVITATPLDDYIPMTHTVITDGRLGITSEIVDEVVERLFLPDFGFAWNKAGKGCIESCIWCGATIHDLG